MATVVVEALVSTSVELLLGKIASREFLEFFRSTKLDNELLEKLKTTLQSLKPVLNDAEQKQITDPDVKDWLVMLQEAVFEAEDLLDEVNTEALRCKVKAEYQGHRACAKLRKFLSSRFKSPYRTINSEMQKLHIKLNDLVDQVHPLGLSVGVSSSVWHGTPTTSAAVDESSIYGRANDKNKLKAFLLSDDAREGDGKIGVVSIVGMGGLGKTTLAKQLFNDPGVKEKFNLKGWAHISKDFDVPNLTKALLESITGESSKSNDLNTLQVELQKSLNGKMFLLVLDDIWDVVYVVWNSLMDIFNVGEAGSRIVITTRNEKDAQFMKTFLPIYNLQRLKTEDCWSLLAKHAFSASSYQQCSELEEIGKEIAQKCDGLPLAAVALGGLLRIKLSLDHWNHVLKSNIWKLQNTGVQPALLLSYHYLPSNLKRCFAYCAIFPKNYELEKAMIVQLWIAEGLVLHPESEKSWEIVGEEYFDELVSRSLIQRRSVDGKEIFEMHDLMNDLATTVSFPYCVRLDEEKVAESLERVRHLSYNRNGSNSYNKFDRLHGLKGLRTFLSLPLQHCWFSNDDCMSEKALGDLLLAMKHLHSLSLSGCRLMTKVPTSIGNLIYLRYLNLSGTPIERLPCETWKLVNLQTLIVSECSRLTELPDDVEKLVNLRNLDVRGTLLKEMPVQITKLKNLQTLSDFIVSKQCDGLKVGDLGKLPHLKGSLSISELQNVIDPSDASQANLEMKQIDDLILKWDHPAPSDSNSQIQSGVLERLQPTVNLKSLAIDGYGGTSFPNWLGDSSFNNVVYLNIKNCDNCSKLPPLGQLGKLKELFIKGMKSVKSVGAEFYGSGDGHSFQPFPSLEILSFEDMQEWEEWNLIGGTTTKFPVLRGLSLSKCPKLKGNIPTNLPTLTKLELVGCPLLIEPWSSESLHNYTSLEDLTIRNSCYSMTSLTLGTFPVLKTLWIVGCSKLKSIVIAEDVSQQQSLSSLGDIDIWNCDELESISFGGIGLGLSIPNLDDLFVYNCEKLGSLLEPMNTLVGLRKLKSMPEWEEWSLIGGTTTEFPTLRHLRLHGCPKLKGNIPTNLPSLIDLVLEECPLLVEPWSSDDNRNMSSSINDCENMKFIAQHDSLHNYTSLEHLRIRNSCYSMTSLTLGTFPVLKTLRIEGCSKLKSIVIAEDASPQQSLSFLSDITIWDCDELESICFGGIGLGLSIPNLDYLFVSNCKKLRSLLEPMNTLVGLRSMYLSRLPNLESIGKDGFPINLWELGIGGRNLWNTIPWERLTCLSLLTIFGGDKVKMEVGLLPTSLVTLRISSLGDIESLDGKWLQHLTSLQNLDIWDARNLKSLPEEGFLSSLSKLSIIACPLLAERWKDKQGKEWTKIAHIPSISVDDERIN